MRETWSTGSAMPTMPAEGRGNATPRPDFFVVGAPKCGTTAMFDYLTQHPEIGMCPLISVHQFAPDLPYRGHERLGARMDPQSEEDYLSLFQAAGGCKRVGESSVWYLWSARAAEEIKEFAPDAQIVVMLRNPVEMLPALHSEMVFTGRESITDFEQALALDSARESGDAPSALPSTSYRAAARFAPQIRRYLEVFGQEQVHVILLDRLRADTLGEYQRLCRFLQVDPTFVPAIQVVNPNKKVRSHLAHSIARRPPGPVRRPLRALVPAGTRNRIRLAVRRLEKRVNIQHAARAPLPPGVREQLAAEFAEDVESLGKLIGEDLSSWTRTAP